VTEKEHNKSLFCPYFFQRLFLSLFSLLYLIKKKCCFQFFARQKKLDLDRCRVAYTFKILQTTIPLGLDQNKKLFGLAITVSTTVFNNNQAQQHPVPLLCEFFLYWMHSKKSRVDSTRLRVDRIDTHLQHTNPTALRVESTRDFLLCGALPKLLGSYFQFSKNMIIRLCSFSKNYCAPGSKTTLKGSACDNFNSFDVIEL
jgi:hypothetical protein